MAIGTNEPDFNAEGAKVSLVSSAFFALKIVSEGFGWRCST
jgi:hypothetical protein